jgi:CxxC-x17-CxxC domain-containing protein
MGRQASVDRHSSKRGRPSRGGSGGRRDNHFKPAWKQNGPQGPSHTTRCASCSKECTVPFKPNGSKPVLCRSCYIGAGGLVSQKKAPEYRQKRSNDYSSPSPSNQGGSQMLKKEMAAIHKKLDRIVGLLSKQVEGNDHELWFEDEDASDDE